MGEKIYTDLSLLSEKISFSEEIKHKNIYLLGETSTLKGVLSNRVLDLKNLIQSNELILKDNNKYILKAGDIDDLTPIKTNIVNSQYCLGKHISIDTGRYIYSVNINSNENNDIEVYISRVYPNNTPLVNFTEMYLTNNEFNITIEKVNSRSIEEAGILLFSNKGKVIGVTCTYSKGNIASFKINLDELIESSNSVFSANLILDGHILPIKLDGEIDFKPYVSSKDDLSVANIKTDSDNNIYIDTRTCIKINPTIDNISFYDSELTIKGSINSNIAYFFNPNYETSLILKSKSGKVLSYTLDLENENFTLILRKSKLIDIRNISTEEWNILIEVYKGRTTVASSDVRIICMDENKTYEQPLFIDDNASTIILNRKNQEQSILQVKNKINVLGINAIGLYGKTAHFRFRLDKDPSKADKNKNFKIQLTSGTMELSLKDTRVRGKNVDCTYKVSDMDSFMESLQTNGITTHMVVNGLNISQTITDINPMAISRDLKEMILNSKRAKNLKESVYSKVFNRLPISKKKVIFESFLGRNVSGNPKYIYEYMVAENMDQNYKFYWVVNDSNEEIQGPHIKLKRKSLKYYYHMATSGYWVFNSRQSSEIVKREGTTYLQTWHGTPLKKLSNDMTSLDMGGNNNINEYKETFFIQSRRWDYLLAQNDYSEKIFKRAFNFNKEILKGYPANDILYNRDNNEYIEKLKEKLGLPADKKVILYAPTWRDNNFYKKGHYKLDLELEIDKMREVLSDEYVLVIKAHYLIANNIDDSKYEGFAYNLSKGTDIQELYLVSDIMITDYSSTMFDYANLKRPMIFFAYDLEDYRDDLRGFYFDFENTAPGPIVKTTDDVISSIKHIDLVKENYGELLDNFYNTYCNIDNGNSAKYIVERVFNENKGENVENNNNLEQQKEVENIEDNSNEPRGIEDESNKNS